jgi:hypothetical protein
MKLTYMDFETGYEKTADVESISLAFLDKSKFDGQDIVVLRIDNDETNLIEVTDFTVAP